MMITIRRTSCLVAVAVVFGLASDVSNAEPGDIALISFASDNPDALSFVVLRQIDAGTTLRFTDSGWLTTGGFRASEGGIAFTSGTDLMPGTVVGRQSPFDSGDWSVNNSGLGSNGFALSASGDQIISFSGTAGSPAFVHAVHFDGTGYGDATTSNTTALPTGLTLDMTAVDLPESDNGYYDGPTSGTPSTLLAAIGDPANWTTSDGPITPPNWSFLVEGEGPLVSGVSLPASDFKVGQMVDVTVSISETPEVGAPVTINLTSGALTSPQQLIIDNPNDSGTTNVTLANPGVWTIVASAATGGAGTTESAPFTVGDPMIPPTANAGPDRSVPLQLATVTITLDGASGNDPEGLAGANYAWTPDVGGGIASWTNRSGPLTSTAAPATGSVTFNAIGTYQLTLTVTDADGLTDADTATITVTDPGDSDAFDPPPGYYAGATGLGSTLKNQLASIMTSGHNQQSYGDFRFSAARYDADPEVPGNILLAYNRASVPGSWDSGATWSREHVWPQSRQPGSASNSSRGNLGDPFALRPVNPSINSQRGNKPFGTIDTGGSFGDRGSFWFPGEEDKGDIARSNFYSATRYTSTLSLVNGIPAGNTMGDLDSLLRWHYTDVPDFFERRRNQLIFEDQNNRSAFVDRPEFVWTVFGDGFNDSTLYVSPIEPNDGASVIDVVLPTIIVDGPTPPSAPVVLQKAGMDPTYYAVSTSGSATSSILGRFNAFDVDPQQALINVGLSTSTSGPGEASGIVVIDNLDVSSEGTGQGSADGNDVINVYLTVLDHSEASFAPEGDLDALTIDFGVVALGSGIQPLSLEIHNLASPSGLTASLDLQAVTATGDTQVFAIDAAPFSDLPAEESLSFSVGFTPPAVVDTYSATYTFTVADADLPGAISGMPLVLTVTGEVGQVAGVPAVSTLGAIVIAVLLLGGGGYIFARNLPRRNRSCR